MVLVLLRDLCIILFLTPLLVPLPVQAQPTPVSIPSLAGTWKGTTSSGSSFTWTIRENGTYESIAPSPEGRLTRSLGRIVVEGREFRWRSTTTRAGGRLSLESTPEGDNILRGTIDNSQHSFQAKRERRSEHTASPPPAGGPEPSSRPTETPRPSAFNIQSIAGVWHGYVWDRCTPYKGAFTWAISSDGSFTSVNEPPAGRIQPSGHWSLGQFSGQLTQVSEEMMTSPTFDASATIASLCTGPSSITLRRVPPKALEIASRTAASWIVGIYRVGPAVDCSQPGERSDSLSVEMLGFLQPTLDVTDDATVRRTHSLATQYVKEFCPRVAVPADRQVTWSLKLYSPRFALGKEPAVTFFQQYGQPAGYQNPALIEAQVRAQADTQRRAEAAAQAARAAQQQARIDRIEAFKRRAKIDTWLEPAQLGAFTANPFPWKGKTVGFIAEFIMMTSETTAVLSLGGTNFIVVSRLPATRFTQSGQAALIAGRVQGMAQATLPLLGLVSLPEIILNVAEDAPR